jgi:hypothetical protein
MAHPIAELLGTIYPRRKEMSEAELDAVLDDAQRKVEFYWGDKAPSRLRFTEVDGPFPGPARCGREGCNYRRYPASRFCMYHVVGHDTFARAKARTKRAAKG